MESKNQYAPILLFVFARPYHTRKTLEYLAANELADKSDLIVYSDAARNESEEAAVKEVRRIVRSAQGYRNVTIIEREKNYGLARNIIEGVTDAFSRYDRVIVLEDDLVTSPKFLKFMNDALDQYEANEEIWHISGWNYPIDPTGLGDAFFLRVMNCWGWATWADRWQHYEKNSDKLIDKFDEQMIRKFDLNNSGVFWSQVLQNKKGNLDTWAIYWYATIFMNGKLCLNPAVSFVDNIGLDGSGTHGSRQCLQHSTLDLNQKSHLYFPKVIIENETAINRIQEFYKKLTPSLTNRIFTKISSIARSVYIR